MFSVKSSDISGLESGNKLRYSGLIIFVFRIFGSRNFFAELGGTLK
jgi:hypothetical protein